MPDNRCRSGRANLMPLNKFLGNEIEIRRDATIIDTNVLVAAFWPEDARYADTREFLFEMADEVIVAVPVVVETWGMLVGKAKRWDCGLELLNWLTNPGNEVILVD